MTPALHHADSFTCLAAFPAATFDAVVTDPPYGIRFMGAAWDGKDIEAMIGTRKNYRLENSPKQGATGAHRSAAAQAGKYDLSPAASRAFQEWTRRWAAECLRVLKPGGHLICFAGTRTYHRMAAGVEAAGFEIRDQLAWLFGQGFPKSHNLDGAHGTALKPAHEPIVLARVPLGKLTVAECVQRHGTGALNIAACRIGTRSRHNPSCLNRGDTPAAIMTVGRETVGRWPANVVLDETAAALLDAQSGDNCGGGFPQKRHSSKSAGIYQQGWTKDCPAGARDMGTGGASRFFYCAKASRAEREAGLREAGLREAGLREAALARSGGAQNALARDEDYAAAQGIGLNRVIQRRNTHPTVKPVALMRWLVRLVTPAGGHVLDPFMGSGTTGIACAREGFAFTGIERDRAYVRLARARIAHAHKSPAPKNSALRTPQS